MGNIERRFAIRWVSADNGGLGGYRVSVPNFDGGEVVVAEDYDALCQQFRGAVEALREIADSLIGAEGIGGEDAVRMQRMAERALARLGGQ